MHKLFTLKVLLLTIVLLGVAPVQLMAGDDFGRLFSSPGARKKLDVLRQQQQLVTASPQQNTAEERLDPEPPKSVTMQGYVRRSDGAATLWINNKTVHENSSHDQVEIGRLSQSTPSSKDRSESVMVRIPATGKNIRLKAGQVYEPENDRIMELKLLQKERELHMQETGVIGGDDE